MAVAYLQSAVDSANQQNYTFASFNFGTASADRIIIVGTISNGASGGGGTVSSMTIGGVSATLMEGGVNPSDNTVCIAMYYAAVPTGTSGSVVVNHTDGRGRCGIVAWSATGGTLTQNDTLLLGTATVANPSVSSTIDVPVSGYLLATSGTSNGNAVTARSWTGVTEDSWTTVEGNSIIGAAQASVPAGQTGRTTGLGITSTASEVFFVAASFSIIAPATSFPDMRLAFL